MEIIITSIYWLLIFFLFSGSILEYSLVILFAFVCLLYENMILKVMFNNKLINKTKFWLLSLLMIYVNVWGAFEIYVLSMPTIS